MCIRVVGRTYARDFSKHFRFSKHTHIFEISRLLVSFASLAEVYVFKCNLDKIARGHVEVISQGKAECNLAISEWN